RARVLLTSARRRQQRADHPRAARRPAGGGDHDVSGGELHGRVQHLAGRRVALRGYSVRRDGTRRRRREDGSSATSPACNRHGCPQNTCSVAAETTSTPPLTVAVASIVRHVAPRNTFEPSASTRVVARAGRPEVAASASAILNELGGYPHLLGRRAHVVRPEAAFFFRIASPRADRNPARALLGSLLRLGLEPGCTQPDRARLVLRDPVFTRSHREWTRGMPRSGPLVHDPPDAAVRALGDVERAVRT